MKLWSFPHRSERPGPVYLGTEFCPAPVGSIGDYSRDFNQKSGVIRFYISEKSLRKWFRVVVRTPEMKLEVIAVVQARIIKSHSKGTEVRMGLGEFGEYLQDSRSG